MTRVAFLGLGLMGRPMAENLLEQGFTLQVWNRTPSRAEAFRGRCQVAGTAPQAVQGADLIITMLENGPAVEAVLLGQETLNAAAPGALVVDMSSVPPTTARALAGACRNKGLRPLDAPVSGGTGGAEQASLSIMVGGEKADLEAARPVLESLGRLTHVGPSGAGQLAKLANQAIVGITIGAVSEALLLASEGGADTRAVRQALLGGFAGSAILEKHGQRMLERDFAPGAPSRIQLKDLRMILDEARALDLALPLVQRTYELYRALEADGQGEADHSALLLALEHLNQKRLRG